jgi:hypothetical protein
MMKKLFGVGCVVFFLSSALALAQYKVDLLTYYQMGYWDPPYTTPWLPADPSVETPFDSGIITTLHVPPCPRGDAIAIETYLAASFKESMSTSQLAISCSCIMNIKSKIIPADIIVSQGLGLCNVPDTPQDGVRPTLPPQPFRRAFKSLIERNKQNWWGVEYKTGGDVPVNQAIKLFNALITKGFDIEFSFEGFTSGIRRVEYGNFIVYISSVSR